MNDKIYQKLPPLEQRAFIKTLLNKNFNNLEDALSQEFQGRKIGGFWAFRTGDEEGDRNIYVGFFEGNEWKELPAFRYYGHEERVE